MYVQVVNFELDGITHADYVALCDELAPAFEAMDGLLAKFWLDGNGTYGGIYVWSDAAACQAYQSSQIWADVGAHPNLVNITSTEYSLLERPTARTSGPFAKV